LFLLVKPPGKFVKDVEELRVRQTVIHEGAAPLRANQASFSQSPQMKRDIGLAHAGCLHYLSHRTAFKSEAVEDA